MRPRDPLAKTLAALRALAEDPSASMGVRELATRLQMPPATAYRALNSLVAEGLARQVTAQGRYGLGVEAFRLGFMLASRAPWRDICPPHLRALARKTGEAPAFAMVDRDNLRMLTVARAHSEHAVRVVEPDGWKPLHAGASGLAMLAFLPPADQNDALEPERLTRETDRTITEPDRLRHELAAIRARGYAVTHGQRVAGAVGIGAPVLSAQDEVIGSIYLSIPEQRFSADKEPQLAKALLQATKTFALDLAGMWRNK